MPRLERILITTDFSEPAGWAAERGAMLAAAHGARATLLHVIAGDVYDRLQRLMGSEAEALQEGLARGTREALESEAEELGQRHGQPPEVAVLTGAVTHAIRDYMERIDADLGVLGASGRGLTRQLWLGSTAERVLRRCRRPVLVTKGPPAGAYRRILVPVDFSRASRVALNWACAVAPEAEVVVLHAFEVPFEGKLQYAGVDEDTINRYRMQARDEATTELGQLVAGLDDGRGKVRRSVHHGYPARVILEQANAMGCDLVVMGKHGRGAVEDALVGSVTRHVLSQAGCDVLVAGSQ
ncbi:universal stress protein [Arhodomonas sp. SL1]|uniref:universal stress protein n=1 Tax=Arhodomonas sp. SL1 TaxID=3425691 RepID=UPI003F884192